jgi:hypothetical protein
MRGNKTSEEKEILKSRADEMRARSEILTRHMSKESIMNYPSRMGMESSII